MYKLDWSLFDKNGPKILRINKINQKVEFSKQVISKEPIYTTKLNNIAQIDLLTNKQVKIFVCNYFFEKNLFVYRLIYMVIKIRFYLLMIIYY
jgi:hypothetical protein